MLTAREEPLFWIIFFAAPFEDSELPCVHTAGVSESAYRAQIAIITPVKIKKSPFESCLIKAVAFAESLLVEFFDDFFRFLFCSGGNAFNFQADPLLIDLLAFQRCGAPRERLTSPAAKSRGRNERRFLLSECM